MNESGPRGNTLRGVPFSIENTEGCYVTLPAERDPFVDGIGIDVGLHLGLFKVSVYPGSPEYEAARAAKAEAQEQVEAPSKEASQ